MKEAVIEIVTKHYLESRDFNGIAYSRLRDECDISEKELKTIMLELLEEGRVDVVFGDYHPNPHIKAFSVVDRTTQVLKMEDDELTSHSCVYPSEKTLSAHIEAISIRFDGRPYEKELALGAGQLDFRAFDLAVLEIYRNDPRYHYDCDDINGRISVRDQHYESGSMHESDQTFLQTFGFCYSKDYDRAVAVYIRYLSDLTPEHQRIWKSKELCGDYKIHPDYFRNSMGEWGTRLSIFEAFTHELAVINTMCDLIGKPHLFRETFVESRPREFAFLLRPTLKEFNQFVHLLDKMMSDNLNKKFFHGVVELEDEEERGDGKIVVRQKGTIQLLEQWISKSFRPEESKALEDIYSSFKEVRRLRQKPAHSVKEDEFDQRYFKDQRGLIKRAYTAIRTIRLILANHPGVRCNPPEIDDLLFQGKIWDI